MVRYLSMAVAVCVFLTFSVSCMAEEGEGGEGGDKPKKEKKDKPEKAAPAVEDVTLTGTIKKDEKGAFTLVGADESVTKLPAAKKPKGEDAPEPVKYDDFVDKSVTVVGTGTKKTVKDKEVITLKTVTSVTVKEE